MSLKKIEKKAQAVLNALDSPDGELSILIVDDPQIAILNKEYLNRQGPTNVIAFPMRDGGFADLNPHLLGDVVISVETARREGGDARISTQARLSQLLVHGILHLFGYDHEKDDEARRMEKKSDELLEMLRQMFLQAV
ncbi:MAG TPA: rRNA maturation RNase YbeY [Deltaproteobacteria bacterium]|nr:rRNA maturation RNase YbeY [Deltaproteobacteria bacterium]